MSVKGIQDLDFGPSSLRAVHVEDKGVRFSHFELDTEPEPKRLQVGGRWYERSEFPKGLGSPPVKARCVIYVTTILQIWDLLAQCVDAATAPLAFKKGLAKQFRGQVKDSERQDLMSKLKDRLKFTDQALKKGGVCFVLPGTGRHAACWFVEHILAWSPRKFHAARILIQAIRIAQRVTPLKTSAQVNKAFGDAVHRLFREEILDERLGRWQIHERKKQTKKEAKESREKAKEAKKESRRKLQRVLKKERAKTREKNKGTALKKSAITKLAKGIRRASSLAHGSARSPNLMVLVNRYDAARKKSEGEVQVSVRMTNLEAAKGTLQTELKNAEEEMKQRLQEIEESDSTFDLKIQRKLWKHNKFRKNATWTAVRGQTVARAARGDSPLKDLLAGTFGAFPELFLSGS